MGWHLALVAFGLVATVSAPDGCVLPGVTAAVPFDRVVQPVSRPRPEVSRARAGDAATGVTETSAGSRTCGLGRVVLLGGIVMVALGVSYGGLSAYVPFEVGAVEECRESQDDEHDPATPIKMAKTRIAGPH